MVDEYLDLVNENDEVIGRKKRSEVYAKNLSNFRVINAFIINSEGKLWIPRRTANKRIFPLCLDVSVGGHVESGESYEEAFLREAKEELNIDVAKENCFFLGNLSPIKHQVSALMKVWEIRTDKTPSYNEDDFMGFCWLRPGELLERIAHGEKAKEDLPKIVQIFYEN